MEVKYVQIGKLVSAHGLKGELILEHQLGKKGASQKIKLIFLEEKSGEMLPYFPQAVRSKTDTEAYVKLESIDTREAALKFLRRGVWMKEADMMGLVEKSSPIGWLGFHVFDGNEDLGEILEVIEQPQQILFRLEIQKKEVLIPVNENTLRKIDHAKKRVMLVLPDGLVAVYLG